MRTTRSRLVLAGVVLGLLASAPLAYAQPYDNYIWQFPRVTNISSTADGMKATLQEEAQKILDAGHLAPLRIHYADIVSEGYFLYHERGRIIATLAWAYPYLTSAQQSAVRTYVGTELSTAAYTPWSTSPRNIPQDQGARRELYTPQQIWGWSIFWNSESGHTKPVIHNLYGLWLYAYRSGDWAAISNNWNSIKSYYTANSGEGNIYGTIGAHVAMARMAQYMNDTAARDTAITNATTAFNDGKTFSTIETRCQNTYYAYFYESRKAGLIYRGTMFLNLSPEVGRYLKDYVSSTVLSRTDQGKSMFPKWWLIQAPYFCRWTGDEGIGIPSEMAGMIFPVERWVRQASADTLAGWMASTPDGRGDCYWLENLVQAIEAYGTLTWTDVRGGGDTMAPAAVSNLSAPSATSGSVTLNWTAPGDDGSTGTASAYDVRYSTATITDANWGSATQCTGEPTPKASGQAETFTVNGLSASTTYYFAMKVADEVPNTSGLSNVVSKATAAGGGTSLLTDGDFQSGTGFTTGSYTAGTSSDGVWYSSTRWVKTTNAGDGGTGDTAATVNKDWSDLRLFQGVTAPANGTSMTLSFKYVRPSGYASYVRVYGLTTGQQIANSAGGTLQGTQLFTYDLGNQSSWTSVTNQSFTVSGTFAKLVVFISVGGNASDKLDDVVLTSGGGGGGDTTAPTAVSNLSAPSSTSSSVTLNWTATGDDGSTGTASSYDVRYSTSTITAANWGSATQASGEPTPKASGQAESFTVTGLSASTTYYFAMKVSDEVPNTSGLSNVVSKATTSSAFFSDDFQSETTGQVPSKWTCNNSSFQTVAESTNKLLKNVGTDSHVWPSDCDSNPGNWQDFELLCRMRDMQQIDFRMPSSGSFLRLQCSTSTVVLYEMPNWTSKGSRGGLTAGTWYWIRLQCNGSSVKIRIWADGASEPSTTDITATTTATAAGKVDFNYAGNISIDDVTATSTFSQMSVIENPPEELLMSVTPDAAAPAAAELQSDPSAPAVDQPPAETPAILEDQAQDSQPEEELEDDQ